MILTESEFANYKSEWQDCLDQSSADPVFASWMWCFSWWKTWSKHYSLSPLILLFILEDELVGIVPLYSIKIDRKFGPIGNQLQVIGNTWRIGPTVRSEHTNFIIRMGFESQVYHALCKFLMSLEWQDFVICDHQTKLKEALAVLGTMVTVRSKDRGICLDASGLFSDWVTSLGKNTRLKVFNRRNYLKDRLIVEEIPCTDTSGREIFFNLLCKLHMDRRQTQPTELELIFHNNLAKESDNNFRPVYNIMKIDGQNVSVFYDIIAGDKRYNLHSAFIANIDKKLSPGLLHLGFSIEQAFENPDTKTYDFLAGLGKKTFYKERLKGSCGKEYSLLTSQVSKTLRHKYYLKTHMLFRFIYNKYFQGRFN